MAAAVLTLSLAGCFGGDPEVAGALVPSRTADIARDPTVLVATTRMPAGDPVQKPWFTGQRSPDLIFAKARMNVPDTDPSMMTRVASMVSDDWGVRKVDALTRSDAAHAFSQAALGQDVLLYVHGYRESFTSAVSSAAQLSNGIGFRGVTGLFTWPSAGSTLSYVSDRESAMWSRDAMEDLLTAIAKSPSGGRVNIVAHSMGTLLTLEALRMVRADGGESAMSRIGAVVMAAPDIDIDLFARGLERLGPDARKITVISATNDRALAVSSRLAGGIVRAGAAERERLESLGVRVADASEFSSSIGINHDLFLSNPDVQQVVKRAIERVL
ncbi:alpha/beta hydrolase [Microvirga pudoricolor]|uniref:alpha/beta hydrolase n=1 Tax=Microvirga pudoricolor TaxID=2778729 RepID=UPI0019525F5E|nr:alpha/beta fold hydrolase [Microvirga pudoricolor]MBM6592548.1 alpha/beta fold hydrolase [Microvirga pudoricolor]